MFNYFVRKHFKTKYVSYYFFCLLIIAKDTARNKHFKYISQKNLCLKEISVKFLIKY